MSQGKTWIASLARKYEDALTLALLMVGLVFALVYLRGWEQPILGDRSFHLYTSQQVARGRTLYVELFTDKPPVAKLLVALPMWVFPTLLDGSGPAYVHVGWGMLWTSMAVVATYYLGKRLSGRWLGGALASFMLIGLTPFVLGNAVLGQNRLYSMATVALTVALIQRERWWWAGMVVGAGTMAYYPAAMALGGAWVLITGKQGRERWRALGQLGLGLAVPIGLVLSWLAAKGGLDGWYRMSLGWIPAFVLDLFQSGVGGTAAVGGGIDLALIPEAFSRAYRFVGDWLPLLAGLSYLAFILRGLLKTEHRPELWRDCETAPPLVVPVLAISYVLVEGGGADRAMAYPFIALWAGWGMSSFVQALKGVNVRLSQGATIVLSLLLLGASGRMLDLLHQRFEVGMIRNIQSQRITPLPFLDKQIEAADALWDHLPADHQLLAMGELWPLVVTGEENASLFYHAGPKNRRAAHQSGLVEESIFTTVLQEEPDLVLFSKGRIHANYEELAALAVEEGYVCVGEADRLILYIRPDDASALAGTLAMQQVFEAGKDQLSPPFEVISPAQLTDLTQVEAREVAPGMVLLGHELVLGEGTGHLILYWWTWMSKSEQASLRVEALAGQETLATWPVAQPSLPRNTIVKETLTLDAPTPFPDDLILRLAVSPGSPQPKSHPCKQPITTEPVILQPEAGA